MKAPERWRPALGLVVAVVSGACGSEPSGAGPPVVAGARPIEITADSLTFDPASIEMVAGEDVALVIRAADIRHNVVIDEVDFLLEASAGQTSRGGLVIDSPGTYTAYCSVPGHRTAGMEMAVTVTAPQPRSTTRGD